MVILQETISTEVKLNGQTWTRESHSSGEIYWKCKGSEVEYDFTETNCSDGGHWETWTGNDSKFIRCEKPQIEIQFLKAKAEKV